MNLSIGKYVHKPTNFVFFSKDIKKVCGKLSLINNIIIELTEKDIELCKLYKFKIYSPSECESKVVPQNQVQRE